MTADDGQPDDIAGLFKKFGGDPHAYREFEPGAEPERGTAVWSLVSPAAAPATPAPSPAQPATDAGRPPPNMNALFAAPAAAAVPPAMPGNAPAAPAIQPDGGRKLDALFARLLGAPAPHAPEGHGLLSRWRSQP